MGDGTPQQIVDMLDANRFGRLVIDAGRDNPAIVGDALLRSARYVGVLRGTEQQAGTLALSGVGMALWLADEDGKGDAIEAPITFTGATFTAAITGLLPTTGSVVAGAITAPPGGGTYKNKHQYQSRREAIDYLVDLFSCDWRVNGDSTLDAGPPDSLFVTVPQSAIIAKTVGADMTLRALPGAAKLARDVNDFSTRVVTVAEGNGLTVAVGTADIAPGLNTYLDPFGNPIKMTRLVSESNTSLTNANARAQLQLNRFTSTRDALTLTTTTHDIRGDVAVGDYIWAFDPDANLADYGNEIVFRGERMWPVKQRVFQLTWPVEQGMGVYFRTGLGAWYDLTDYVVWESGQTNIVVAGYDRSLTNTGSEPVGARVVADSSVPGVPVFGSLTTGVYQSTGGASRARLNVPWTQPLNTDGSVIVDGDHYELQYRSPSGAGTWTTQAVGFDQTSATIVELTPATDYGIRIRAVDAANPPNVGAWSTEVDAVTAGDTIAPATPAPPSSVVGNPVSVQVVHTLGVAAGGTYNLDSDLAYLEVHASTSGSGYTTTTATQIGKLTATAGMMAAGVKAIGTFTVSDITALWIKVVAVDDSGNRSAASAAVSVTAGLVDSVHISTVTATQIDTGTFSATYGIAGLFISGNPVAARFESGTRGSLQGGRTYRPSGTLALQLDALTGDLVTYQTNGTTKTLQVQASTGNVYLYKSNGTTPALTLTASTGLIDMTGKLTAGAGVGVGATVVVDPEPVIKMYPSSALSRYEIAAYVATTPGGTTGPVFDISAFGTGSSQAGPSITAWDDGIWFLANQTGTSIAGGQVQIYADAAFGAFVGVEGGSNVNVTSAGIVLNVASGDTVRATAPFGTLGAGFSFHAQSGSSAGYRTYSDGSYLRFVENSSNAFLSDNKSTTDPYKCFVIDHPLDDDRWLVHSCIEAPEAQVEYRDTATIYDGRADITLPRYFTAATVPGSATVHVTMLLPDEPLALSVPGPQAPAPVVPYAPGIDGEPFVVTEPQLLHPVAASAPNGGRFRIVSPAPDGTRVAWLVKATRADGPPLDVEPLRTAVRVTGDGPYRSTSPLRSKDAA